MTLDWGDWISLSAAVVSVIALVLNYTVIIRQTLVQAEGLRATLSIATLEWGRQAVEAISSGMTLTDSHELVDPERFRIEQKKIANTISSLADQGRFYFPNFRPKDDPRQVHGSAFSGHRPPVLDALVFAFHRVSKLNADDDMKEAWDFLLECRRLLVTEIQEAVGPRRRGDLIRRLTRGSVTDDYRSFRKAAELGNKLESEFPGTLSRPRDEAWLEERIELSKTK